MRDYRYRTAEDDAQLTGLLASGLSHSQAAQRLGLSVHTISGRAKRMRDGVAPRPPSPDARAAAKALICGIVDCADCSAPVAPLAQERGPIRCAHCWEAHIERVLAARRRIAA